MICFAALRAVWKAHPSRPPARERCNLRLAGPIQTMRSVQSIKRRAPRTPKNCRIVPLATLANLSSGHHARSPDDASSPENDHEAPTAARSMSQSGARGWLGSTPRHCPAPTPLETHAGTSRLPIMTARDHIAQIRAGHLENNYIWMMHDGSNAVVVDPGAAERWKEL